ncbi:MULTISPECIES: hypothetical protein [Streptomyces]|uniref:hypothetical protein n=1 Tax=Streptomyces TaxID=1883 RepID=UPI0005BE431B|nr:MULTISPECIES: hypothetical protein [Streptomyces]MDP9954280.1 hypothetical protein [Streptomyces sp. DSM 41269]
MNTEQHPVGQAAAHPTRTPAVPTTIWQPTTPTPVPVSVPALTLYQVPVPGAVQVQLPDGRIAWGRPVDQHLDPVPVQAAPTEAMPGWAKAVCLIAGSLTVMALGSATALRIAAPALGGLVDLLDMLWKVALTLAVILFGLCLTGRFLFAGARRTDTATPAASQQPMVFAPQIDTGGTRVFGRSGDINIQFGDRNRNKQ